MKFTKNSYKKKKTFRKYFCRGCSLFKARRFVDFCTTKVWKNLGKPLEISSEMVYNINVRKGGVKIRSEPWNIKELQVTAASVKIGIRTPADSKNLIKKEKLKWTRAMKRGSSTAQGVLRISRGESNRRGMSPTERRVSSRSNFTRKSSGCALRSGRYSRGVHQRRSAESGA